MCVCVSLVKWNYIIAYDIKKNCVQLINGSVENGINSDWVISWMTTACWTITKRSVQAGQWAHDEWMRILVLRWYSVRVNMCVLSWWHSDGPEFRERALVSQVRWRKWMFLIFLSSLFFHIQIWRETLNLHPFYIRTKHYTPAQSASSRCDCARKTAQILKIQHSQAEEFATKKRNEHLKLLNDK